MATKTINELTSVSSAADTDELELWRTANGDTRKITKTAFMGGIDTEMIAARTAISFVAGSPPANLSATLAILDGKIANVLAYGGDNTGVADTGAPIAAALAARDIVFLPPGDYRLATSFTVPSNKKIYGQGATLTKDGGGLTLAGDNIIVEGITFVGTATDHTAAGVGGNGLNIDATADRNNIVIRNCTFEWLGTGIGFTSPATVDPTIDIKNVSVESCTFRHLTQHYMSLKKTGGLRGTNYHVRTLRVVNCTMEDIYHTGVYVWGPGLHIAGGITVHDLIMTGCYARNILTAFIGSDDQGWIDGGTITGCIISGQPDVGTVIHNRMGMDLNGTERLTISVCNFDYISEECIALFNSAYFSVTGCNFSNANVGIGLYAGASVGCHGTISGCTFTDMQDPSIPIVNTSRYGILLAEVAHRVKITGCIFEKGSVTAGAGIRIETVAHPYTVIANCHFRQPARGIWLQDAVSHITTINACVFDACTTAAIQATTLLDSIIANCRFIDCAIDINATTSSYVRCMGNMHDGTTGIAINLSNADRNAVVNSVFRDVVTVHGGTAEIGASNLVYWQGNHYVGSTTPPTAVAWYLHSLNVQNLRQAYQSTIPTGGTWATGDIVWDSSPTAGSGFAGWICTAGGTPGTWKTFGAISA